MAIVSYKVFQAYMGQDSYFLKTFAKAFAFALTKSDSKQDIQDFR